MKSRKRSRDLWIGYSSLLASCRGAWDAAIQLLTELERPEMLTIAAAMSCFEATSDSRLLELELRPRVDGRRPIGSSKHLKPSMPRASQLKSL